MLNKFHPIQLTYFSFSLIGFVLNITLIIYNRCYGTNNLQEIDPNEKKRESIKRSSVELQIANKVVLEVSLLNFLIPMKEMQEDKLKVDRKAI